MLGSMDSIPLASSSVDYVYCCEVLHHNDPEGLRRTFREIFRVLRPGGRLLMVNETLKTVRDPSGVNVEGVEQFEGYEHAHWALAYRWEAMRAGFLTDVTEPHYRPFFGDAEYTTRPDASRLANALGRAAFPLRRLGLARRLYLWWLNNVQGRRVDEHDRHQAPPLRRAATRTWPLPSGCCARSPRVCASRSTAAAGWRRRGCRGRRSRRRGH